MHNNMITINGQKMGKSLGNFITLDEFFTGSHPLLIQAYSPMTIRFFILQAHYRSTVDFSNEALQASEKALDRMLEGWRRLADVKPQAESTIAAEVDALEGKCYEAMDDDLNTPITIAHLFEAVSLINKVRDGHATATADDVEKLRQLFNTFLFDILGVKAEAAGVDNEKALEPYRGAVDLLLQVRAEAKAKKDWATSDLIRDRLAALGFAIKDTKDGVEWSVKA
jgi:cysteinyl-tRNA synthetase